MTLRHTALVLLLSTLVTVPAMAAPVAAAEEGFDLDARVALDAFRATVETHLNGVLTTTRALAATEEVRSGAWEQMRGLLAVLAGSVKENAAIWYARPDGSYFTVEDGLTGQSLHERAYFPALLDGRDVAGALVISKSTGKRSVIVASPVRVDGKVAGAVGVSIDAEKLAAMLEGAIRLPADIVFYALDSQGQTALHRAGELIFVFPTEAGSPTLRSAVKTMLEQPEGTVHYQYGGSDKTAIFEHSSLTGWVFVLGRSDPAETGAVRDPH